MIVAGARPNFMKIAPILRVLDTSTDMHSIIVHTGQHYDQNMSGSFFKELGIREPDFYLDVGSGSHAVQTAEVMKRFESVCIEQEPDIVVVVGDVNSTIATGLVAKKLKIKLAHIEAGLRSGDRDMPEEINRLATDSISDLFFTTEHSGSQNLIREGHSKYAVHFVGHVMIDNLFYQLDKISNTDTISPDIIELKTKLPEKYICMTLHRPSNVDHEATLTELILALQKISNVTPIVFPCHPRTYLQIEKFGLKDLFVRKEDLNNSIERGIVLCDPLGYNDFLFIWSQCLAVLTDSGGLQEETTALRIPCFTLRENTERPVTVEFGTNRLIGRNYNVLINEVKMLKNKGSKKGSIPELWDGKASQRIISILRKYLMD